MQDIQHNLDVKTCAQSGRIKLQTKMLTTALYTMSKSTACSGCCVIKKWQMRENNPITCDIHSFCVTQQVVHQLRADIVDGNGCVNSIDHRQGCCYMDGLRPQKRAHIHIIKRLTSMRCTKIAKY